MAGRALPRVENLLAPGGVTAFKPGCIGFCKGGTRRRDNPDGHSSADGRDSSEQNQDAEHHDGLLDKPTEAQGGACWLLETIPTSTRPAMLRLNMFFSRASIWPEQPRYGRNLSWM